MKQNERRLIEIVRENEMIVKVLDILQELKDAPNCYLGAGAITNTIWNYLSNYPLTYGISDIDIVYFNSGHLEPEYEETIRIELISKLGNFPYKLDVKNQARVHLWYEKKFGFPIKPYTSVEDAINSWPTTATALGMRKEENDIYKIYSPYSLDDLFSMIVRPNKRMITREIFEVKAAKWKSKWPELTIISW
ncbi:nucleotidyltransferase family protein [Bacillus sp. CGMCC 1.16607]|uniref:nucleotidyltransferase family protein n=1 Tax=Bacillus sp. CGMCC 1.16607 TaxID=3351842 RepID=UPI00362F0929